MQDLRSAGNTSNDGVRLSVIAGILPQQTHSARPFPDDLDHA
jgi:hypothetical protein